MKIIRTENDLSGNFDNNNCIGLLFWQLSKNFLFLSFCVSLKSNYPALGLLYGSPNMFHYTRQYCGTLYVLFLNIIFQLNISLIQTNAFLILQIGSNQLSFSRVYASDDDNNSKCSGYTVPSNL